MVRKYSTSTLARKFAGKSKSRSTNKSKSRSRSKSKSKSRSRSTNKSRRRTKSAARYNRNNNLLREFTRDINWNALKKEYGSIAGKFEHLVEKINKVIDKTMVVNNDGTFTVEYTDELVAPLREFIIENRFELAQKSMAVFYNITQKLTKLLMSKMLFG